jgi:hypothetical protein
MSRQREGVAVFGRSPRHRDTPPRAQLLVEEAAEATKLRAFQTHPDVIALRVERVRTQVDRLCWAGIVLALAFTMTNVQSFAAAGAPTWSARWWTAWLLDPMVSLVLLAILRAEQVTSRYQVRTGTWVRAAKWLALTATYLMNTWAAYASGVLSSIVLHSVPPLMVLAAAEAVTDLRDRLTEAATVAFTTAAQYPAPKPSRRAKPVRRTFFDDYLAAARAAWRPGVEVTPAWVREVTGCSRGLSSRLAASLAGELEGSRSGGGGS